LRCYNFDIFRSKFCFDFRFLQSDEAWNYYAGAAEMAALAQFMQNDAVKKYPGLLLSLASVMFLLWQFDYVRKVIFVCRQKISMFVSKFGYYYTSCVINFTIEKVILVCGNLESLISNYRIKRGCLILN